MNTLIIFAKYPEPGEVKTRLAERVGHERATALYKEMVEEVVKRTAPTHGHYYRQLYFDPPERRADFGQWLPSLELREQQGADLGARMYHALDSAVRDFGPSMLIGTDCVDIDELLIDLAFHQLEIYDLVLGPALDGGYYLIGTKEPQRELFEGIAWSTDQVFAATQQRAKALKLSTYLLPEKADLDW